jgi:hypothetical protein
MRAWLSVPVAKGIRVGISGNPINPNSFVTRRLPWFQCLSDTGKNVSRVGGVVLGCGFLWWVIEEKDRLDTMWLTMLIAALIAEWTLKRTVLGLFPRRFQENEPAAPPVQRNAFGEPIETRYNSFGEPIETPPTK